MNVLDVATESSEARSTRDLILDAAEGLFAEHGYAGVSMRDITAEAGLGNQASLYHHFRNKRALYEVVLARALDPIVALAEERDTTGVADDARAAPRPGIVEASLDRLAEYLADHPQRARLIHRSGLDDSRYLRRTVARLVRPVYDKGLRALAVTGGPWQPAELPYLSVGLYHLLFGYFANAALLEAVLQEDPRSPAAIERQRRFIKTAVARLLGVGPAPSSGGTEYCERRE